MKNKKNKAQTTRNFAAEEKNSQNIYNITSLKIKKMVKYDINEKQ